jgi:DeoR family transcriptional regulator of aga operon
MYAISTGPSVTVVTNALNIANELVVRPHVKVVVTGGVIRPQSYELIGPLATLLPAQVSLDLAILGVDGIDADAGATAHHEGEASINQLMVSRARQVIIVADASKLGVVAFARICPTESISTLVTDSSAEPQIVTRLRDRGLSVVTA